MNMHNAINRAILAALRMAGDNGATGAEIAVVVDDLMPGSGMTAFRVASRIGHMRRAGYVIEIRPSKLRRYYASDTIGLDDGGQPAATRIRCLIDAGKSWAEISDAIPEVPGPEVRRIAFAHKLVLDVPGAFPIPRDEEDDKRSARRLLRQPLQDPLLVVLRQIHGAVA